MIWYLFNTLLFGMIQIWLLYAYLKFTQVTFQAVELIADGGLFIFATSVAVTAFLEHDLISSRLTKTELRWSRSLFLIIILISVVGFLSAVTMPGRESSFDIEVRNDVQNGAQVIVSVMAVLYGCIVQGRVKKAI